MSILRKVVFYIFVVIYIIGCPIIILNSLGVVFFPNQEKLIQSTGLISLATIPNGAVVSINSSLYREKTPLIIRNLPEGEYSIQITLDNYVPWKKRVHVAKRKVTNLENVILIPKEWPKNPLSLQSWERLVAVHNNPYIILRNGKTGGGISFFRIEDPLLFNVKDSIAAAKKEAVQPLFSQDSKYNSLQVSSIIMMPKSHFVLLRGKDDVKRHDLWIDLRSPMDSIRDISDLLISAPDFILWHSEDNENIFYAENNNISRINIEEHAVYPDIVNNVKSLGIFNKKFYIVDGANQFQEVNYINNTKRTLMGEWFEMPEVFKKFTRLEMRIVSEKLILFMDDTGCLLSTRLPYELVPSGVTGIGGVLDGAKVLVWTKTLLGVIDFGELKREGIFEAGPKITWVVKNAKNIQEAFWVNNGSHILFRDIEKIKLAEIDYDTPASTANFKIGEIKGETAYSDSLGKVFFIDKDTDKLMSLTVVPEHGLIQFVFPDSIERKKH
ncbi:MAG: PEGA domain-containing protein [Candidatus Omnitrophota bacterium]